MSNNFKVIIVGGGPMGLCAAHALRLAGIDFVVLEGRPTIFKDEGAGIGVHTNTLRILHQFGLLDSLTAIGSEFDLTMSFNKSGYRFAKGYHYTELKKKLSHGRLMTAFHRAELLEVLYNGLPHDDRAKVLINKKVNNIASDDTSVTVTCSDASIYKGSMVIGADGAHSVTRRLMRDLALAEDPARDWDPEKPFVAEYNCVWSCIPPTPAPRVYSDTQSQGRSTLYLAGKDRGWLFLTEKLPQKTTERVRYTEKDVLQQAAKFADYSLTETHRVRDVFTPEVAATAGMFNLEEGIAQNWSWGRIVLVGDACHRIAPHSGQGFQSGLQDIVVLCNGLRRAVVSSPGGEPDVGTLGAVFDAYKEARWDLLAAYDAATRRILRFHTWASWKDYLLARFIFSWSFVGLMLIRRVISPRAASLPVLDYVPASEPMTGIMPWVHPMPEFPQTEDSMPS